MNNKDFKLIRCENCLNLYKVPFTLHHPDHFYLKLKYSSCPICSHPRTNEKVKPGQFQCKGPCNIIYTITKKRYPVAGMCMACYMEERRNKFNRGEGELV